MAEPEEAAGREGGKEKDCFHSARPRPPVADHYTPAVSDKECGGRRASGTLDSQERSQRLRNQVKLGRRSGMESGT